MRFVDLAHCVSVIGRAPCKMSQALYNTSNFSKYVCIFLCILTLNNYSIKLNMYVFFVYTNAKQLSNKVEYELKLCIFSLHIFHTN